MLISAAITETLYFTISNDQVVFMECDSMRDVLVITYQDIKTAKYCFNQFYFVQYVLLMSHTSYIPAVMV